MWRCASQGKDVFGNSIYYYTVADCFNDPKYNGRFKSDTVPANHLFKGTRIWRTISLEEGPNKALFNSNRKCQDVGLFEIIKFGLFEKHLNAFASDNFADAARKHLTTGELTKTMTYLDTTAVVSFDETGREKTEKKSLIRYLLGNDVKSYLLKEDWVINSYTGKTEKYIIGMAPLVYNEKEAKLLPLFWLYYPEWRNLLSLFEAKNIYSYDEINFADVFERGYFISQIAKESNVFDRSLRASCRGYDAVLQNELILEKLRNSESDLFEH